MKQKLSKRAIEILKKFDEMSDELEKLASEFNDEALSLGKYVIVEGKVYRCDDEESPVVAQYTENAEMGFMYSNYDINKPITFRTSQQFDSEPIADQYFYDTLKEAEAALKEKRNV